MLFVDCPQSYPQDLGKLRLRTASWCLHAATW